MVNDNAHGGQLASKQHHCKKATCKQHITLLAKDNSANRRCNSIQNSITSAGRWTSKIMDTVIQRNDLCSWYNKNKHWSCTICDLYVFSMSVILGAGQRVLLLHGTPCLETLDGEGWKREEKYGEISQPYKLMAPICLFAASSILNLWTQAKCLRNYFFVIVHPSLGLQWSLLIESPTYVCIKVY